MNTPEEIPIESTLTLTDDMHAILDFLEGANDLASTKAIAFRTSIPEWRVEIDVKDMADEGWLSLSRDADDNTVAKIIE